MKIPAYMMRCLTVKIDVPWKKKITNVEIICRTVLTSMTMLSARKTSAGLVSA